MGVRSGVKREGGSAGGVVGRLGVGEVVEKGGEAEWGDGEGGGGGS